MYKRIYVVVVLFLFSSFIGADPVVYYDTVPSLEEVQRQLLGNAPSAQGPTMKKRFRSFHIDGEKPLASANTEGDSIDTRTTKIVIGENSKTVEPVGAEAETKSPKSEPKPGSPSSKVLAFPINFDNGSAKLRPESEKFLAVIADIVNQNKISLMIEGHTDISGNPTSNFELSRDRAYSVVNHLVDVYGVDPARLSAMGMGSKHPIAGEPPNSSKNRRVQVRLRGV